MTNSKKTVSTKKKTKTNIKKVKTIKKSVVKKTTSKKRAPKKVKSKPNPKLKPKKSNNKKETTKKKVVPKKAARSRIVTKTHNKDVKSKSKSKVEKQIIFEPDTTLSCHLCGKLQRVSFEYVWIKTGWPRCCNEGMHIEDSSAKIGEVMNRVWVQSGGYGKSLSLAN